MFKRSSIRTENSKKEDSSRKTRERQSQPDPIYDTPPLEKGAGGILS